MNFSTDRNRFQILKKLYVSLISVYSISSHVVPYTLIDVFSDERSFVPLIIHITRPMHLCHRYRGYDRSEQRHKRASPRIRCFIRCLIRPGRHYPPRGSYYQHGGLSNHPSNDDIEMKGRRRKKKKKKIYIYIKRTRFARGTMILKRATLYRGTSGRGWNRHLRLGEEWKISRVESFDRVKDDRRKEFEGWHRCTPRGHVLRGRDA